ncbi:MAG: GldG family protein, partial [Ginsengibacter sp.]
MKPFPFKNRNKNWWWTLVIVAIVIVNFLASAVHWRIDLTNEKRFTISSPVKKILGKLDNVATVDIFLTGDLPAGFKNLSTSAEEMLQEFKEYANGRIKYRFVLPDDQMPGSTRTYADTLSSLGIVPINLKVQLKAGEQSQYVYPAALVNYKGRIIAVNLYAGAQPVITPPELNSAEAMLEYKFADAIYKVVENKKPMIAYSIGNGEPTGINTYDLVENVLKKNYSLFTINMAKEPVIPDTFKLLLIVKPALSF